jgi:mannose/fructose-specific phosphotransferase system component IIA
VSDELLGVVVAHGGLAGALVTAAEEISGIKGSLVAVSNAGCDRAQLEQRVHEAIGGRPAVLFVDLPSGSCLFAALRGFGDRKDVRVVTGVNLVMLLEFLFHRADPLDAAARRAAESGLRGINQR